MDIRCKRCLLREMANEDMYHRIQRTIDAIPPKLRCSKGEYDARLELCKECEKLIGGMCRVCGCFVEVRAAKKANIVREYRAVGMGCNFRLNIGKFLSQLAALQQKRRKL